MTKESITPGPAFCAAAAGVRAKSPAPMIAPIPKEINPGQRRLRLSPPFSSICASRIDSGLVRKRDIVGPRVYHNDDPGQDHQSFTLIGRSAEIHLTFIRQLLTVTHPGEFITFSHPENFNANRLS